MPGYLIGEWLKGEITMEKLCLLKFTKILAVLMAALLAAACSSNNGTALNDEGSGIGPIKLFGEASDEKTATELAPGEVRSVKLAVDQADLKKAIHRYRITEKITGGAQQIAGVDLNGDGQGEALVYFEGAEWCISTGCRMVLFVKTPNGFRKMTAIERVKKPVLVSPKSSNGWRDMIVRTGNAGIGEKAVGLKFGTNYPGNATLVQEKLAEVPAGSETIFAAGAVALGAN